MHRSYFDPSVPCAVGYVLSKNSKNPKNPKKTGKKKSFLITYYIPNLHVPTRYSCLRIHTYGVAYDAALSALSALRPICLHT